MSSSFASQNSQVVKYEKKDQIKNIDKLLSGKLNECQLLVEEADDLIDKNRKRNKELEIFFFSNEFKKLNQKAIKKLEKQNEELSRKIETQFDLDDIELGASSELNKLKENPDIKLTEQFIEFSKKENVKLFEVESNCSILTEKLDEEAGLWDELINRVNNKKGAKTESNFIFSKKAEGVIQEIKYCLENIKESIKELDEYHIDMKSKYPEFFDDRRLNNFDESLVAIIQNKRAETQAIRAFTLNRCVQAENLIKLAENMLPLISERDASKSLTTTAKFLMLTLPSCAVVVIYYWPSIWKKIKQYQEKIKKRKIKGQK